MSLYIGYHTRIEAGIVFSSVRVCVWMSVCLSVNRITPEPLEISSQNFQAIIIWSKKRTNWNMTI